MNSQRNDKKSALMLILSLGIVGTIGILRRHIPITSALLAFFRGLIGALFLLLILPLRKKSCVNKINKKKILPISVGGVFLGINWILLFEAYNYTTIAKATLCYYLEPTIVLLLSPLIFRERLTSKKIACAVVSVVGMFFVSGMMGSLSSKQTDIKGVLFGLGAAFFYSLVVIINKKTGEIDAYQKTIIQLFSAAVVLVPYLLLTENFSSLKFEAKTVILVLIAGIIYTGIVYALYFGSMNGLKAQTISVLSYVDPIVALFVSAIVLEESLSVWGILGAVLILGAAFISEYDTREKKVKTENKNESMRGL